MGHQDSLLWVDFMCEACHKPIKGHKHMKLDGRHYHMVCGMRIVFPKGIEAKA